MTPRDGDLPVPILEARSNHISTLPGYAVSLEDRRGRVKGIGDERCEDVTGMRTEWGDPPASREVPPQWADRPPRVAGSPPRRGRGPCLGAEEPPSCRRPSRLGADGSRRWAGGPFQDEETPPRGTGLPSPGADRRSPGAELPRAGADPSTLDADWLLCNWVDSRLDRAYHAQALDLLFFDNRRTPRRGTGLRGGRRLRPRPFGGFPAQRGGCAGSPRICGWLSRSHCLSPSMSRTANSKALPLSVIFFEPGLFTWQAVHSEKAATTSS